VLLFAGLAVLTCLGVAPGNAAAGEPTLGRPPEVVVGSTDEQIEQGAPGEKLVCYSGSWSEVEGFKYQWLLNGAPIAGATQDIFTVEREDEGGELQCEVTAVANEGNEYYALSVNTVRISGVSKKGGPPKNITAPQLTGNASVKGSLACSQGEWTESPETYTYEWLHTQAGSWVEIVGAMSPTYIVQESDAGDEIKCEVTAKNKFPGSGSAASTAVSIPAPKKPTAGVPEIKGASGGVTEDGATLTCSPGTWGGEPTFAYQWLRGGAEIGGATGVTYTVEHGDELNTLACRVTGTNAGGSTPATSKTVEVLGEPPEPRVKPTISGSVKVGETVQCNKGEWGGNPSPTPLQFKYTWLVNKVSEGTGTSFKIGASARGKWLVCEVTVKTSEGTAVADSEERLVPNEGGGSPPKARGIPTISGGTGLGEQLACNPGAWEGSPTPTLSYQWLRKQPQETAPINGATEDTYSVAREDLGYELVCRVEGVNEEGNAFVESAPLAIRGEVPAPPTPLPPLAHGALGVGASVTCLHGAWTGAPAPSYEYSWRVNGVEVASGSNSYTVVKADLGYNLACEVTGHNDAGSDTARSEEVRIPGSKPIPPGAAPEIVGTPAESAHLECVSAEWSGTPTPTLGYQWSVDSTVIPGATATQFVVGRADVGRSLTCEVIGTNTEGEARTASSPVLVPGAAPSSVEGHEPAVTGTAAVGQTLTCNHGIWEGEPAPEFSVQWLLDEEPIAGATGPTYGVELADEGHSLSCEVIAHNDSGTETRRTETRYIPYVAKVSPPGKEPFDSTPFNVSPKVQAPPTAAEILAALSRELTRAEKAARLKKLLKTHPYPFTFAALVAGKLEYSWYLPAKGGHLSANSKPILVAHASMSFGGAATKTLALHVTHAGLELFTSNTRLTLKAKGVFSASGGSAVTWTKKFVLSH